MNTRSPIDPLVQSLYQLAQTMAQAASITSVVWREQSGPSIALPVVIIGIDHMLQIGNAETSVADAAGNVVVTTNTQFEMTFDVYGQMAVTAAAVMRAASNAPLTWGIAQPWSIAERGPVVNVSALLDKTFKQPRARFHLLMQGGLQITQNVGYIASAQGSGQYTPNGPQCNINIQYEE